MTTKCAEYQQVSGKLGGDKDGPGGAGNTVNPGPNHPQVRAGG